MKFHRVKLKNLNSLYGEQVIDFEDDIRNSPLFLIIGPTGAGKSTILDAICLALFGQTPRLERRAGRSDTDVAHIMSMGTAVAHAEADFSVLDPDGTRVRYVATWSTRRAYDDPEGAVQRPERSLYQRFDDGTMRLLVADHREKYFQPAFDEALRGLSVDDFKRSILLAQGEFSAFLHASDSEKASILERLTNTDDYRIIGERAARKRRAVDERHRRLMTRMEEMQVLTRPQEEELTESLQTAAASMELISKEAAAARKKVEWLRRDAELDEATKAASMVLATAKADCEKRGSDYRRLTRDAELLEVEPAWREVKRLTDVLAELGEQLGPVHGEIEKLQTASETSAAAVEKAKETLEERRNKLKAAEPEIRRAHELRTRREGANGEVEAARKQVQQRVAVCDELDKKHKATLEKKPAAQQQLEASVAELQRLESSRPLLERIGALRATYVDGVAPLEARIAEIGEELESLAARVKSIEKERSSFDEATAQATKERAKWQGQVTRARNKLEALTSEWGSVEKAVDKLSSQNQNASIRAEALREARFLLQRIEESERERNEVFARAERTKIEVAELEREEAQVKELETAQRAHLRQCEQSLRLSERLIALSSYRRDLDSGDPCPLCGSPIHPYCASEELDEVDRRAHEDRERLEGEVETARAQVRGTNERVQRLAAKFVSRKTALGHDEGRVIAIKQALEDSQAAFADAANRAGYSPLEAFQLKNDARVDQQLDEAQTTARSTRAQLDEIEVARQALTRADEKLEEAERARRTIEDQTRALQDDRRHVEERITTRRADQAAIEADRKKRQKAVFDELESLGVDVEGVESTEVALTRAEQRRDALVAADSKVAKARENLASIDGELAREQEKLAESRAALEEATQREAARAKALAEIDEKIATCLEGKDPEVVRRDLDAGLKDAREALDAATQTRAETAERLSAVRARLVSLQEHREKATDSSQKAEVQLSKVLRRLELARGDVEAHLLEPDERKRLKAELDALEAKRARAATRLEDATRRLALHRENAIVEDGTTLDTAAAAAQESEERLNEVTLELGALRERWAKHEQTKSRRSEIESELRDVQRDADVWNTIYGLIGVRDGERFKLYAQSLNLQGLVDRANHRLEKLHPRYRLCVQRGEGGEPTLSFGVVDRYQANVERPLTTLSGGETFLVSLALALALADFRQVDMPIETLLLDEGFGTLDQDSLHMALTTLHQLHYDAARQIGIISHVEALKELIDSRIVVEPVGHGRSQIRFEFGAQVNPTQLVLQR